MLCWQMIKLSHHMKYPVSESCEISYPIGISFDHFNLVVDTFREYRQNK